MRSVLVVAAVCSVSVLATNCNRTTGNATISFDSVISTLLREYHCPLLANYSERVNMSEVDFRTLWEYENDEDFTFLLNMLHNKGTLVEILNLDTQWVGSLSQHLVELDVDPTLWREKWHLHRTESGRFLTIPRQANQVVMYYRKDLFDKYNKRWPETWEEFESTVRDIQDAERAVRGVDDYWGFVLSTDNAQNRIVYTLVTLLSSFNGGQIVEANGTVTINNPAAAKTLRMWKSWFGKIVSYEAFGMSTAVTYDYFIQDKAVVLLHWAHKMPDLAKVNEERGWNVAAASIPGPTGAGCSGDWSIGISKYTENLPLALEMMNDFLMNNSDFLNMGREPLRRDEFKDPDFFTKLQARNPLLADSMQKYPEFWDRLVHRPAKGCGFVYSTCADIIFKHVYTYMRSSTGNAEQTVAKMHRELEELLGIVDFNMGSHEVDVWTDSRIALICTTVVALWALVVLGMWVRRSVRKMRTVERRRGLRHLKLPVAVCIGTTVMVLLGVVLGVVVMRQDSTTRTISRDLSADGRVQSIFGMEVSIYSTIDLLVGSAPFETIKQRALGKAMLDLGRMRTQPKSLVVILDRKTGEVVLSTNPRLQPVGAHFEEAHPWVYGIISSLPNWRKGFIDPEVTHVRSVGGEVVFANMVNVARAPMTVEEQRTFTGIDWILLYATPEEAIMSEANAALDEALDLAIILAVVVIILATACAAATTAPLVRLAEDMVHIKSMEIDLIQRRDSIFTEISELLCGFGLMCDTLKEYRSFLPAALLERDDSDSRWILNAGRAPPCVAGKACVVFTDIQSSTSIWEAEPVAMKKALEMHNVEIRRAIDELNGYEVKTIGDAFMITFDSFEDGLRFGLRIQVELANMTWPAELATVEACCKVGDVWNGLRVRVGVVFGEVNLEESPLTGRTDYLGSTVNKAARLESAAPGGTVAIFYDDLRDLNLETLGDPVVVDVGPVLLKGIGASHVAYLLPEELKDRERDVVCAPSKSDVCSSYSTASSVKGNRVTPIPLSTQPMLKNGLRKMMHTAIVSCQIVLPCNDNPAQFINDSLSAIIGAVERCEGIVSLVWNTQVVASWNATKQCRMYISQGVRAVGLLNGYMQGAMHVGLGLGPVVCGTVTSSTSTQLSFCTVLGITLDIANALAETSCELQVFALCASSPGSQALLSDQAYSTLARPVDTWDVETGGGTAMPFVVCELNVENLTDLHANFFDDEWGWSPEYRAAYHSRDASAISRGCGGDPILLRVASNLKNQTSFRMKPLPNNPFTGDNVEFV